MADLGRDWAVRRFLLESVESPANCSQPVSESFPFAFFTTEERRKGLVIINVFITLYSFGLLAVVCHEYFVPAVNKFAQVCRISHNVAGASLMAAMASVPQLATTLLGSFVVKDDIGLGAVVGSSFFNILCTPAVCVLVLGKAKQIHTIELRCWPLLRDSIAYIIAVILLTVIISDQKVYWYESMTLVVVYCLYILVLAFNDHFEKIANKIVNRCKDCCGCCSWLMKEPTKTTEKSNLVECDLGSSDTSPKPYTGSVSLVPGKTGEHPLQLETSLSENTSTDTDTREADFIETKEDNEYKSILSIPDERWKKVVWAILLPGLLLIFVLIPDFRRPGLWKHLYPITMVMSVVFIGLFAYVLVWMISIIGETFSIPTTVMGMTVMAMGGSMPDMINSVCAALDGHGDMAIANAIGSNLFDILFCLGVPWLFNFFFVEINRPVPVYEDMQFVSLCLLTSGVLFPLVVLLNRWKLDRKIGVFLIVTYFSVIIVDSIFEFRDSLPLCVS